MSMEYINKEQFDRLKNHRYVSEGRSVLEEHVLRHFWDYLVKRIPVTWAPNTLTVAGLVVMIIPFFAILIANPTGLRDDLPSYYYYTFAASMFIFQTLDNLDGRQARRTKTSNALGEFFDHSCDTISDPCMTLALLMALGLPTNLTLFLVTGLLTIQDYGFYWRAHWKGKYVFGDVDISEIQFLAILILVLTGYNPKIWEENTIFGLITWQTFIVGFYFAFSSYYFGDVIFGAVQEMFRKDTKPEDKERAVRPMITLLLNITLALLTTSLAPEVYENYPACFIFLYLLVLAKLSCRLLISNMTKEKMVYVDTCLISYAFLLLSNNEIVPAALALTPSAAIFVAIVYSSIDFTKYCGMIASQMADFLGVYCFSVEKRSTAKQE